MRSIASTIRRAERHATWRRRKEHVEQTIVYLCAFWIGVATLYFLFNAGKWIVRWIVK